LSINFYEKLKNETMTAWKTENQFMENEKWKEKWKEYYPNTTVSNAPTTVTLLC